MICRYSNRCFEWTNVHLQNHASVVFNCLPARALVANMKAYNGKYSCTSCEDSGEEGSNPLHRVWPFNAESTTRNKATVMKAVCDAVQQQTSVSFVWSVIYMNGCT